MVLTNPSTTLAFFRTPGVGRKVLMLLAMAFAALVAIALSSVLMTQRTRQFNARVAHTQQVVQANRKILELALNAETGQRGYLLTGDASYLRVYWPSIADLPPGLDRLQALVADNPQQVKRVTALRGAVQRRVAILRRTISLADAGERFEAIRMVQSGQGRIEMGQIRAQVAEIDDDEQRLLAARGEAVSAAGAGNLVINAVGLVLVILVAVASIFVFQRYLEELMQSRLEVDALNRGLEDKVVERTEALTRANDEIQRFAYIVSHDLRAPLVNVMGYTSELEQAAKSLTRQIETVKKRAPASLDKEAAAAVEEDLPEAIGFIRASTAKMDRLIKAILRLSRDGRRVLTPETLDMTAIVTGVAKAMQAQVDAAGAELVVEPLPVFVSDRLAIEQVFGNLMENAVKYLAPGRPGRIRVSGAEQGGDVVFRIEDNGRGIDAKDHERVYELFRRSGPQDQPGEGLGLAFVRSIVRRLQGVIDLDSELGRGSTFTVKFPKTLLIVGDEA